jgi:hypothetical protein
MSEDRAELWQTIKRQKSSFLEGVNLLTKIDYQAVYKECLSGLQVPSSETNKKDVIRAGSEAFKCLEVQLAEFIAWNAKVDLGNGGHMVRCPECITPLLVYAPILFDGSLLFRDDFTFDSLIDALTESCQCVWRCKLPSLDSNLRARIEVQATYLQLLKSQKSGAQYVFNTLRNFDYKAMYEKCLSGLQVPSATTNKEDIYRSGSEALRCLLMQLLPVSARLFDVGVDLQEYVINRVLDRDEL